MYIRKGVSALDQEMTVTEDRFNKPIETYFQVGKME